LVDVPVGTTGIKVIGKPANVKAGAAIAALDEWPMTLRADCQTGFILPVGRQVCRLAFLTPHVRFVRFAL